MATSTGDKLISTFELDLSSLPANGEARNITIAGDVGAEFILEIKNKNNYYYNFVTSSFQSTKANLETSLVTSAYKAVISFPAITENDQYDVYLYAKPGTKHANYTEVRFLDGSLDINSSVGSNSLMMQKVIYQYTALTLTLSGTSFTSAVSGTTSTATIATNRGKSKTKTPFSFTFSAAGTAAYRIVKQPVANDVLAVKTTTIGAAPETLPGEDIYPTATAAFTGDDINGAITSGSVVRMDNTDLSAVIKVGDKITTPTTTSTVSGGDIEDSVNVNMDHNVTTIMSVGDQVTVGVAGAAITSATGLSINNTLVTVAALSVGGDTSIFALSEAIHVPDGTALIFSSKINRSLTTVTVVETSGTATDFTMSQAIQFRDNAPLTFFNQKNRRWPVNNINNIPPGMILVPSTNVTAGTKVSDYKDTITVFANTKLEKVITKNKAPALDTKNQKPTVVDGKITVQPGSIVFDKQQVLALAGSTVKIGGYGEEHISYIYGYEVLISNLAIALSVPSTTTTEATSAHATIAVADREGVINNVSRVGGIGIDPSVQNPLVTSGGGTDGEGDWVMAAVQTLENGVTLTIENTGRVATITGDIEIIKAGTANATLEFDVDNLLSNSAPS
tara:strand:+ start:1826 stop:3685 length:1860 start_codon:yes stop_codon:yes gene_type:complete